MNLIPSRIITAPTGHCRFYVSREHKTTC